MAASAMSIPPKKARLRKIKRENHVEQVKSVRAKRKEITRRIESLEQRVQELVRTIFLPHHIYSTLAS